VERKCHGVERKYRSGQEQWTKGGATEQNLLKEGNSSGAFTLFICAFDTPATQVGITVKLSINLYSQRLLQKSSSELNLFHASLLRISKTFSAIYFCWSVAPFCCTLSGWMHSVAFLYCFLTAAPVIKSVKDTACHPHSGQSIFCEVNFEPFISPQSEPCTCKINNNC